MATREEWEAKVFEMFVAIHKSLHTLEMKVYDLDNKVRKLEAQNGKTR